MAGACPVNADQPRPHPRWDLPPPWTPALVDLVAAFALIYWSYGSPPDFGPHTSLTRLDAIYFSVGTLTTGTGSINAVSEAARAVQMIQQLLDLAYIGFAAALVIGRLGELKTEKRLKDERLAGLMAERNQAFT